MPEIKNDLASTPWIAWTYDFFQSHQTCNAVVKPASAIGTEALILTHVGTHEQQGS